MSSERAPERGHAFGLRLRAAFDIPGLDSTPFEEELPTCCLRMVSEAELDAAWPSAGTRSLLHEANAKGLVLRTIDSHPEAGYRLSARYFGRCRVSPDGAVVDCVPPATSSWRWQRFLVGRALPLAAMLRGHEVFHASAIAADEGVTGFVGPSGIGKTSLALNLVLAGAGAFVTDDVLVLDSRQGGPYVLPGIGVSNVRLSEQERLGERSSRLGAVLGTTGRQKTHYRVERFTRPVPLERLYLLRQGAEKRARILPIEAPDPRHLLANTFILRSRPPESLGRLLDMCSRITRQVAMFELHRGTAEAADVLANRLAAILTPAG